MKTNLEQNFEKSIKSNFEKQELPAELYRTVSNAELYLTWRDQEVCNCEFIGSEDSDIPSGAKGCFWFDRPVSFERRTGFIKLNTDSLEDKSKIIKSTMRYKASPSSLEYDDAALSGQPIPEVKNYKEKEFFTQEVIPLDKLEVSVEKVSRKCFVEGFESLISQYLDDIDWIDEIVERDLAEQIQANYFYEFDKDKLPKDKVKIVQIPFIDYKQDKQKIDSVREKIKNIEKKLFAEDWVSLEAIYNDEVHKNKQNESYRNFLYIKRSELKKHLESLLEYIEWLKKLPEQKDYGWL